MKKILEIKSGELQRYKKVNAITKATSIDCYDDHSRLLKRRIFDQYGEDQYHLVNAVKQILQMKPMTAERKYSKHSSRKEKIEIVSAVKPNDRLPFRNKEKDKVFEDNEEDQNTRYCKEKMGCIFVQIDKRIRSKIKSSKSSRIIKRQYQFDQSEEQRNRIESFKAKKTICYKQQDWRQNTQEKEWRISVKKTKRENQITKIPDFIKASLKNYEIKTKVKQQAIQENKESEIEGQAIQNNSIDDLKMEVAKIPQTFLMTNKKELMRKMKKKDSTNKQQENEIKYENQAYDKYNGKRKDENNKNEKKVRIMESIKICGWNSDDENIRQ